MDIIRVMHNAVDHTLTVWPGDPQTERIDEETSDEVVLMKHAAGKAIGFELLQYRPAAVETELAVETVVR